MFPLFSFGRRGGRHCGPAAAELSDPIWRAQQQQGSGYFLDEGWSEGNTDRKHVCSGAGGELGWRQLYMSQQWRISPESHYGPDQRGREPEEKDPCEKWPRFKLLLCCSRSNCGNLKWYFDLYMPSCFVCVCVCPCVCTRVRLLSGHYLRCWAQNFNGQFHCSWSWHSTRIGKVSFIKAHRCVLSCNILCKVAYCCQIRFLFSWSINVLWFA